MYMSYHKEDSFANDQTFISMSSYGVLQLVVLTAMGTQQS